MKKTLLLLQLYLCGLTLSAQQLVCGGLVHDKQYDHPDRAPIYFGGWSRANQVDARQYCIYADIVYADGSALWARMAEFSRGTHDWEFTSAVCQPEKPVRHVKIYAFVRDGSGEAEFKDVFLSREAPAKGTTLVSRRVANRPYGKGDALLSYVWNGKWADFRAEARPGQQGPVNPLGANEVVVWTEDSMRRVTPLTFPSPVQRGGKLPIAVELAGNEHESFQLLVSAGDQAECTNVTIQFSKLRRADGQQFKGRIKWERQGYLSRRIGGKSHPSAPDKAERWLPEPLLPAAPFKVRSGGTQGVLVTLYASCEALPGVYHCHMAVLDGKRQLARLPLKVRVRNFALPAVFGFKTSFSYMDGFAKPLYPSDWQRRRRMAHDVLLDHRLNPDDITRTDLVALEDVKHMKSRGANAWNLVQIAPEKSPNEQWLWRPRKEDVFTPEFYDSFVRRLRPLVEELRRHDLMDGAYIYGFDECESEYYSGMRELYLKLKRDFPDLPIMTTARIYNDLCCGRQQWNECLRLADWFCGSMKVYSSEIAGKVRADGHQAWWYTCLEPEHPYLNFGNWEYPFIEGRLLLGVCSWRYRVDGFLYWHANNWRPGGGLVDEDGGETFFPDFHLADVGGCFGDGVFLYPGRERILPGMRLTNVRDGEEDWEYLALAERKVGRAAVERLVAGVLTSKDDFQASPQCMRKLRRQLADLIER